MLLSIYRSLTAEELANRREIARQRLASKMANQFDSGAACNESQVGNKG